MSSLADAYGDTYYTGGSIPEFKAESDGMVDITKEDHDEIVAHVLGCSYCRKRIMSASGSHWQDALMIISLLLMILFTTEGILTVILPILSNFF